MRHDVLVLGLGGNFAVAEAARLSMMIRHGTGAVLGNGDSGKADFLSVSRQKEFSARKPEFVDGVRNMARGCHNGAYCGPTLAMGAKGMSCYFFQLEGHASAPERVEMKLEDPAEAQANMVVAIGELLRSSGGRFWSRPDWRIGVTDETGRTLCTLTIQGHEGEPAGTEWPTPLTRPATAIMA